MEVDFSFYDDVGKETASENFKELEDFASRAMAVNRAVQKSETWGAQKQTSYSPWEAEDEKLKEFHVYSFAQLPKPSGWSH